MASVSHRCMVNGDWCQDSDQREKAAFVGTFVVDTCSPGHLHRSDQRESHPLSASQWAPADESESHPLNHSLEKSWDQVEQNQNDYYWVAYKLLC